MREAKLHFRQLKPLFTHSKISHLQPAANYPTFAKNFTMTSDQLKDLRARVGALRRYL